MIKVENIETYGWEAAIRGMRNPMNSWEKSDSYMGYDCKSCGRIERDGFCEPKKHDCHEYLGIEIGQNDLKLMKNLCAAGTDHRKFMRMINVTMDITAPLYWWKEYDTYKVGTVANSCSTMHKIHENIFVLDNFSYEHLNISSLCHLKDTIDLLNEFRKKYNDCVMSKFLNKEDCIEQKKEYWYNIIQLLPSSYNQKRTVQLNYEVLTNMYHARKNHKLDEWREFCKVIETLPYSELITGEKNDNN